MEEGFGGWHPANPAMIAAAQVRKNHRMGAWLFIGGMLLLFAGAIVSSTFESAFHFKFLWWQNACFVLPVAIATTIGVFGLLSQNSIMEVPSWVPLEDS